MQRRHLLSVVTGFSNAVLFIMVVFTGFVVFIVNCLEDISGKATYGIHFLNKYLKLTRRPLKVVMCFYTKETVVFKQLFCRCKANH